MVAVEGGNLYAVSQRAVHQIFLADDIDPLRTNTGAPTGSQKILSSGADSSIVSSVFLTSSILFKHHNFGKREAQKLLIELALEVTKELLAAEKIKLEVRNSIARSIKNLDGPKDRDFAIPSVPGLNASLKSFVQRLEHALQLIFEMTTVFYPKRKEMYDGFAKTIAEKFDKSHDFVTFSMAFADLARFLRNTRSCIEHPKPDQRFIVKDFCLDADGSLRRPTIEVHHKITPQQEMDAGRFLKQGLNGFVENTELLFAFLTNAHINVHDQDRYSVGFMHPSEQRPDNKVRLSYFVKLGGIWRKLN